MTKTSVTMAGRCDEAEQATPIISTTTMLLVYSDLARRAHITPQSMHATIAQLVDMGAVATESRGRASYPRLTDHGRQLLSFAAQAAADCDAALAVDPELIDCMRTQLKSVVGQLVSADTPQLAP
jgi:DNA-binding MarR family transcriptional regulator